MDAGSVLQLSVTPSTDFGAGDEIIDKIDASYTIRQRLEVVGGTVTPVSRDPSGTAQSPEPRHRGESASGMSEGRSRSIPLLEMSLCAALSLASRILDMVLAALPRRVALRTAAT